MRRRDAEAVLGVHERHRGAPVRDAGRAPYVADVEVVLERRERDGLVERADRDVVDVDRLDDDAREVALDAHVHVEPVERARAVAERDDGRRVAEVQVARALGVAPELGVDPVLQEGTDVVRHVPVLGSPDIKASWYVDKTDVVQTGDRCTWGATCSWVSWG